MTKEQQIWVQEIWNKLDKKLSRLAEKSFDKIPYTTKDGVHDDKMQTLPDWWTNGFWPAMMIVMYAGTKNEQYLKTARHGMDLMDVVFDNVESLHHDVGFMWNISSGADYRLTGDKKEFNRFLLAANMMMGRFNCDAGFCRAWNNWTEDTHNDGWAIIDCMMNLPLLFRATQEIKDERFAMVAKRHADKTMQYHIRGDGSCKHIVEYDPITGEYIKNHTGQGYSEESSWSRGQAWGLYGFALAYRYTKNPEYLDTAKRIAHYFISCVQSTNWLPLCDFRQPAEPVLYDSTAGMCAACGLLEIADLVPDAEKELYRNAAWNLLVAMEKEFCDWSEEEDSIVQMGTEAYNQGHHMPIVYGDYFLAEAIYRLMGYPTDFLW